MNNYNILFICRTLEQTLLQKFPILYKYVTTEMIYAYDAEVLQDLLKHRINIDNEFVETNMTAAENIADKHLYNNTDLK